jgi:peroxin-12
VPYLRAKAQDYYEQLGGGVDADILEEGTGRAGQRNLDLVCPLAWIPIYLRTKLLSQTFAARLRRAFKAIYPYANVTYEVLLLGYNMAFLFEKTAHYRPWLAWMGLDLRRLGPHDYVCSPVLLNAQTF